MTLRNIASLPDPILRRKARPVTAFDKDLQTLIDDMIETMRAAPGVGLAAPQVSISRRLIVVEYAEEEEQEPGEVEAEKEVIEVKPKLYVLANPEIVKASEETVFGVEGCLSIPGVVGEVERNLKVQVKALNRRGKPMRLKAEGWLARILQHEIDHLNGVLFPDRAARVWQPQAEEVSAENEV
jgi:peptide deformylase